MQKCGCFFIFAVICVAIVAAKPQYTYSVEVLSVEPNPVVTFIGGNSDFQQVFNPSYVPASDATGGVEGLMIRTQNCTSIPGTTCTFCGGEAEKASVLTFAKLVSGGTAETAPVFERVTNESIVYDNAVSGLGDLTLYGTEDPRVAYDKATALYYMFYTCYGKNSVLLCLATSPDPTSSGNWTSLGPVFPKHPDSKSAALLVRDSPPHYLLWGDQQIRIAVSDTLTSWPDEGTVLISPRPDNFDSQLVESGPPPLRLSTGDYLFLHNSANLGWPKSGSYHVSWAILSGADPTQLLQRADSPLMSPDFAWEQGVSPWACNAPNVVFLEAAAATDQPDTFRVYFGGSDAVVGSAVVRVTSTAVSE